VQSASQELESAGAGSSYQQRLVAGGGDAALAGEYLLLGAEFVSAVQ